jgi:hypothetical protein
VFTLFVVSFQLWPTSIDPASIETLPVVHG